jgi:hypothetical protein
MPLGPSAKDRTGCCATHVTSFIVWTFRSRVQQRPAGDRTADNRCRVLIEPNRPIRRGARRDWFLKAFERKQKTTLMKISLRPVPAHGQSIAAVRIKTIEMWSIGRSGSEIVCRSTVAACIERNSCSKRIAHGFT